MLSLIRLADWKQGEAASLALSKGDNILLPMAPKLRR